MPRAIQGVGAPAGGGVRGELAALAAALAFGMSAVTARRFMYVVAPEAGVLVSVLTNVVVFATLALATALRYGLPALTPLSIVLFVVGGLAGTLVGRNLSYLGIERLGPSLLATIRLSQTMFTLLFGLLVLRELPRSWQLVGLAVVSAGLWVSLGSTRTAQPGAPISATRRRGGIDPLALLFGFGSAAAFALGDTVRRAALTLTPSPVLGAAIGAAAALTAQLLWSITHHSARWPAGPALRSADLWISAICNTIAILLLYTGLRYAPVAVVSVLYNLQVLVVLVASRLLLRGQEPVGAGLVGGSALALAGTAMIVLG